MYDKQSVAIERDKGLMWRKEKRKKLTYNGSVKFIGTVQKETIKVLWDGGAWE